MSTGMRTTAEVDAKTPYALVPGNMSGNVSPRKNKTANMDISTTCVRLRRSLLHNRSGKNLIGSLTEGPIS